METSWSKTQMERLKALGAGPELLARTFQDESQRDRAFQEAEGGLVKAARDQLDELRTTHRRPALCRLESRVVEALVAAGFVQVATPTLMSRGLLARMGVTESHELFSRVFWVEEDRCLRPMLAPHLYFVVKDLLRLWDKPVRIFEVGSCFRRDSEGGRHANEFTMLNVCEFGLPLEERKARLMELAESVMEVVGLDDFAFEEESSVVYGETVDVVSPGGLELGSGAMGPHPLDRAWRITDTWVGLGFGLERLLMAATGSESIGRMGRSLAYLDGIPLRL